jgi:DNA-binding transcriptional ArsR family regulator
MLGDMDTTKPPRQVTDSKVLAAMAHPLRRRLMDVLKVHGPATVSVLAERTGQRVPNVSHHLRVLADVDLVGEAPELARDRRERWWRLLAPSLRWSTEDFTGDPAEAAVAQAALSLDLDRHTDLVRAWYAADEEDRSWWQDAGFSTDKWAHLTPEELAELSREVIGLFTSWSERVLPDDGRERRPVLLFAYGVPAQP